jgi:hypothetical protein
MFCVCVQVNGVGHEFFEKDVHRRVEIPHQWQGEYLQWALKTPMSPTKLMGQVPGLTFGVE